DKLGLGFEPWRFNKYKSAPEQYSHSEMSETDREQNQAYIDSRYELVRENVCNERGFSADEFDQLVDDVTYVLPNKAVKVNLVDTLGRWSDMGKIIKNLTGEQLGAISRNGLLDNALPQSDWGARDRIVVIYGLGDCEMDRGIRARWLEQLFLRLARDKSIRAVVFRVDSPGGLTMPGDIVAQAVKKCAAEKPVIVSQGQMAASGGYMISTYADSIVAGPSTVTGSIGIYGGWVYDKGIGGKIGMNSDFVSRGKHADLMTGIKLPYIGLQIPARNLTADEYDQMENVLHELYDDFVTQVSIGRGLDIDS
ncbi:MAG: S49 family peptidase, partial [candidate division Zixibacteria bacterium]|nr:S49 family peptidase [candidate division Zixibacteria bacterium]